MARAIFLSLRALLLVTILGISFGANALPMSPKWMKSAGEVKKIQPGLIGDGTPDGVPSGGAQDLPLPGSAWLVLAGVAGMVLQRRNRSTR